MATTSVTLIICATQAGITTAAVNAELLSSPERSPSSAAICKMSPIQDTLGLDRDSVGRHDRGRATRRQVERFIIRERKTGPLED